jgi:hypothetical protein
MNDLASMDDSKSVKDNSPVRHLVQEEPHIIIYKFIVLIKYDGGNHIM